MTRIPTLDGWRGIAILLVLFDHIQFAFLGRPYASWTQSGQHGVTIFFVLSGFLITSRLIERPIDLRSFYIRRFFRLMPAAWTYLGVLWFIGWRLNEPLLSWDALKRCVLFYQNFQPQGPIDGLSSHFWSLSLEEQFYLVWPPLLLLLGTRKSRWIAAAGAIGCSVYRWTHWTHYDDLITSRQTQVRADALLVGCLLALLLDDQSFRAYATRASKALTAPAFLVVLICAANFPLLPPLCESVGISILMCASVLHPHRLMSRALAFGPLAGLGVFSYSVYVWQQLFMGLEGNALAPGLCIGLPLVVFLSHEYIELPCIRLGHKLTRARIRAESEALVTMAGEG